jgi:hypothetical protein
MNGANRDLSLRIRHATGFLRQLIDLAEEQQWTMRCKEDGFLFFPPRDRARIGFESVFARDPRNDSRTRKIIMDRFKKAGLNFPDEHEHKEKPMNRPNDSHRVGSTAPAAAPVVAPTQQQSEQPANVFDQLNQKIDEAITVLSEIGQLVNAAKMENSKLDALRTALQAFNK